MASKKTLEKKASMRSRPVKVQSSPSSRALQSPSATQIPPKVQNPSPTQKPPPLPNPPSIQSEPVPRREIPIKAAGPLDARIPSSSRSSDAKFPRSSSSRLVLLLMLLGFVAVIAFVFILANGFGNHTSAANTGLSPSQASCHEGDTKQCTLESCSGFSTCHGGSWGVCRWKVVCAPYSKASCLNNSCVYGYKECDGCGSGYGPCITTQ